MRTARATMSVTDTEIGLTTFGNNVRRIKRGCPTPRAMEAATNSCFLSASTSARTRRDTAIHEVNEMMTVMDAAEGPTKAAMIRSRNVVGNESITSAHRMIRLSIQAP